MPSWVIQALNWSNMGGVLMLILVSFAPFSDFFLEVTWIVAANLYERWGRWERANTAGFQLPEVEEEERQVMEVFHEYVDRVATMSTDDRLLHLEELVHSPYIDRLTTNEMKLLGDQVSKMQSVDEETHSIWSRIK